MKLDKAQNQNFVHHLQALGLDTIAQAKGGHIGMTISAMPILAALFRDHLNLALKAPKWINRDRLVLSAGHGVTALYSLFAYCDLLTIEELKAFKQGSKNVASHPEMANDNFIDASTGPIGQGLAMASGMALAETFLAQKAEAFPGLIDHYTYVIAGDGDLQEGIVHEALSLAGLYQLKKLIVLFDSNKMQIDSPAKMVNNENLKMRLQSYGFQYFHINNDLDTISQTITLAKAANAPAFIEVDTIIAENLASANSPAGHYGPFSDDDSHNFKKKLNLKVAPFELDANIKELLATTFKKRSEAAYQAWEAKLKKYQAAKDPRFLQFWQNLKPFASDLSFLEKANLFPLKNQASRVYVADVISKLSENIPHSLSLNADLATSTRVRFSKANFPQGNHLLVGIREFAMAAIMNGLLLHGGLLAMASTFLVFSDYLKSALRLGAMMELPALYVFSHDSYQVGGDGPTHQPYDQIPMLRKVANTVLWRPAHEEEMRAAFSQALKTQKQTHIIIATRQSLNSDKVAHFELAKSGIYALDSKPSEITLAASGSEIDLALEIKNLLAKLHYRARVVSVPSLTKALQHPDLPAILACQKLLVTIEASADDSWYRLAALAKVPNHLHQGAYSFGFSHFNGDYVYKTKGFEAQAILKLILAKLA